MSNRQSLKLGFRLDKDIDRSVWRTLRAAVFTQVLDFGNRTPQQIDKLSTRKLVRRLALTHRFKYIKLVRDTTYNNELAARLTGVRGCTPFGGYFRFKIEMRDGLTYEPPSHWHCGAALCPHCHARRIAELHTRLSGVRAQRYELLTFDVALGTASQHREMKKRIIRFNENLGQKLKGLNSLVLRSIVPPSIQAVVLSSMWRMKVHVLLLDPQPSKTRWQAFQDRWGGSIRTLERLEGSWQSQTSPEAVLSLWTLPKGFYHDQTYELAYISGPWMVTMDGLNTFTSRLK